MLYLWGGWPLFPHARIALVDKATAAGAFWRYCSVADRVLWTIAGNLRPFGTNRVGSYHCTLVAVSLKPDHALEEQWSSFFEGIRIKRDFC
jgi:hypothetical protein